MYKNIIFKWNIASICIILEKGKQTRPVNFSQIFGVKYIQGFDEGFPKSKFFATKDTNSCGIRREKSIDKN